MENPILGQYPEGTVTYDYRMYDRIWQRVSPDLDPYPEVRAAAEAAAASAPVPAPAPEQEAPAAPSVPAETPAAPAPAETPAETPERSAGAEDQLPGAEKNPCCMGTQAQESINVLAGFIEEELAERRYYLALAQRTRHMHVLRLLRRLASEKQCAARDLSTAYYLITGQCYTPTIAVDSLQWDNLAEALRSCYHQEACSGFNYARAADGAPDPCLQKLFTKLSQQSYRRADEIMCVLGQVLC